MIQIHLKSLLIGVTIGVAPFWIMASDIKDLSELKSTLISMGAVGGFEIWKICRGSKKDE